MQQNALTPTKEYYVPSTMLIEKKQHTTMKKIVNYVRKGYRQQQTRYVQNSTIGTVKRFLMHFTLQAKRLHYYYLL